MLYFFLYNIVFLLFVLVISPKEVFLRSYFLNLFVMQEFLSILVAFFIFGESYAQLITKTFVSQGEIVGFEKDGAAVYPAIPFAEPPVGDLRWKAPVPKKPWKGVYDSNQPIKRPWQPVDPKQIGQNLPLSEDCLYLSVVTPAKSVDDKLPVLVLIHGGGFVSGVYNDGKNKVPQQFMKNDIVTVSIEYRMGVLGFLATPELSKESPNGVSGNYGILDQIEALKWVKENIHAFGGDPNRVTIYGSSAGSISCSILAVSPLAKGLFNGIIAESGTLLWPIGNSMDERERTRRLQTVEAMGVDYMKLHKCKSLKQLRKLPADSVNDCMPMGKFWPNIDGYVIPDDLYKLFGEKKYNDVPLLLGTCSDEGHDYGMEYPVPVFQAFAKRQYGDMADRFLELYPVTTSKDVYRATELYLRDGWFGWMAYSWANQQSATTSNNVYYYYYDHITHNTEYFSENGATHCANWPFSQGVIIGEVNEIDKHLLDIMPNYWMNFIKTGNPNQAGIPYWPAYEPESDKVMIFKNGLYVGEHPTKKNLQFYEEFYKTIREKKY